MAKCESVRKCTCSVSISSPESTFLLVSTKNTDSGHFQFICSGSEGPIFVTVDNQALLFKISERAQMSPKSASPCSWC